jgi:hypothetical protein
MNNKRTLTLNFFLPAILVTILAAVIYSLSINSVRQQFESGNIAQNQNIEVLTESVYLSSQLSQIHHSVESSLRAAIAGKMSNARLYRVHVNAVNSLNRIADRIKTLSQSRQILEASPQDGQKLLEHFEKYRNFVILTTDISSIEPKAASRFVDQAQSHYSDFSAHAHHISELLAGQARKLNEEDKQLFDAVFNRVILVGFAGMFGILLLSAITTRKILKKLQS